MTEYMDPYDFEDEVRRVARELWPSAAYSGAEIVDGRERDGIFPTEFTTHVLECTAQNTKLKAEKDIGKIFDLIKTLQRKDSSRTYLGWFVTLNEPTADQRAIATEYKHKNPGVACNVLSYDQFRCKFIDSRSYLTCRNQYKFGSIADPETGNTTQDLEYVKLGLLPKGGAAEAWSVSQIVDGIKNGGRYLVVGDYGAGKSMTLRQVYKEISAKHLKSESKHFPIFINLRDHQNQSDPVEALHRHAKSIGFSSPDQLVRAWRAGYGIVLLDGFDEIARAGWSSHLSQLRQARHKALELVRQFVNQTPPTSGIIISGRQHFFDNEAEQASALGVSTEFQVFSLSEFTDNQIIQYLRKHGWSKPVPAWLPARPLLLGYLASKKLLLDALEADAGQSPAAAWDTLLDKISAREANIEAGINGENVRRIIERLASTARKYSDGIGPLSSEDLARAYKDVCFVSPDDLGLLLLQRLPGLGAVNAEDGTRQIIDESLGDAARAGDVIRFVKDPFNFQLVDASSWQCLLGNIGTAVAGLGLQKLEIKLSQTEIALRKASEDGVSVVLADIIRVLHETSTGLPASKIIVREVLFQNFEIDPDGAPMGNVEYQECLIGTLDLPVEVTSAKIPVFRNCSIGTVENRAGKNDIPQEHFPGTEISKFSESSATTSGIMDLPLAVQVNVMLTILKKVYLQKGRGRRESALSRGLDHKAQRYVPVLIDILAKNELLVMMGRGGDPIWLPVRSQASRVRALLASPTLSKDPIISLAEAI